VKDVITFDVILLIYDNYENKGNYIYHCVLLFMFIYLVKLSILINEGRTERIVIRLNKYIDAHARLVLYFDS